MLKSLEGARLGLFVFLGTALTVLAIFLIGNRSSMFSSSIHVKSYFENVEGLRTGAPVRLSGLDIGSVDDINLMDDTTGLVEVNMRIEEDAQHFLRLDSKAAIETEGLVGKKIVNITPGSPKFEIVSDGGVIQAKQQASMAQIIEETQSTIKYLNNITKDFSEIVTTINSGEGTIGKLIKDDKLYTATVDITQSADRSLNFITKRLDEITGVVAELGTDFESIITDLDTTLSAAKRIVVSIEKGEGALGALISDESTYDSIKTMVNNLTATTEEALLGTSRFAENMEALKHNWLFKSYFEERGYWDKAEYQKEIDMKLEELREQNRILEEKLESLRKVENDISKAGNN